MTIFHTDSGSFGDIVITGSILVSGTFVVTGSSGFDQNSSGLTGSLYGSSSYATTSSAATSITFIPSTASFATTASSATSITFTPTSASHALTASYAPSSPQESSSFATTASAATSITFTPTSASYSVTSSWSARTINADTASYISGDFPNGLRITGSLNVTGSITSSNGFYSPPGDSTISGSMYVSGNIILATGYSISSSAGFSGSGAAITGVISSSYATSASWSSGGVSASYAITSSWAAYAASSPAGGIGGSGVAGNIAKFTDTTVIGNSALTEGATSISSSLPISGTLFTGSFSGSGAAITGVVSSSYALTSSAATSITFTPTSASYALTSSHGVRSVTSTSASYAESASWAPGGPGGTVGPGTENAIAKFITTTTIGDSRLIDAGTTISASAPISGTQFTGSFSGDGSGVTGLISSSFATTASAATSITFAPVSASYALSSSYSYSGSYAESASWAPGGQSSIGPGTQYTVPIFATTTTVGDSIQRQSADGRVMLISGALQLYFTSSITTQASESVMMPDFLVNHSYMLSQSLGTLTGTTTARVDVRRGQWVTATAGAAAVITWQFVNTSSLAYVDGCIVYYASGGQATNTWPTNTEWPGGTAPTLTPSGGYDILTFTFPESGRAHGILTGRNLK